MPLQGSRARRERTGPHSAQTGHFSVDVGFSIPEVDQQRTERTNLSKSVGRGRPLPASITVALREDAASGDASTFLWRVLIGAAAARWRYADVAQLVETSVGLEHVLTSRDRSGRRTRPLGGPRNRCNIEHSSLTEHSWWQAEQTWMQAPRRAGANRRPAEASSRSCPSSARAHTVPSHVDEPGVVEAIA